MATPTIQNSYVGDGSTVLYSFTFPYIAIPDIVVTIDNVVQAITTEYILANATTIQFLTPPANGAKILIRRYTSTDDVASVFFPGSAIRARDLNDNFVQSLYVAQESTVTSQDATDSSESAEAAALAAQASAESAAEDAADALDQANAASQSASQAQASAAEAQAQAAEAQAQAAAAAESANNANNDATSALSAATRAETKADAAVVTANEAETIADGAVSTAGTALSTANQALTNSATAINTANAASNKADTAIDTATSLGNEAINTATDLGNEAISTATSLGNQAINKAEEAQDDADLAVVIATNALTIADGVAQSGEPFGQLYNASPGASGSKVIDLGDLSSTDGANDHFPNEDSSVNEYSCSVGTGTYSLGSV